MQRLAGEEVPTELLIEQLLLLQLLSHERRYYKLRIWCVNCFHRDGRVVAHVLAERIGQLFTSTDN